jgi:uncharacterized protein YdeI (YjbR/CyaY-like superfamily)
MGITLIIEVFIQREIEMDNKFSRLKRPRHDIPDYVIQALNNNNLMAQFHARPAYQQNDYIGWITRARQEETRQKRLAQMLDELQKGNKYMKMRYQAR